MEWLYAVALGYLLGSVPFGLILTRAVGAGDLRSIGSGNIGATNVLRTGRKGLAAATLLLDAGKGLFAVLLAALFWPGTEIYGAVGAFLGHCFPVWLRFKGGKGLATLLGVSLGLGWPIALAYAGVWLSVFALTRISSLAGMGTALAMPVAAWFTGYPHYAPMLAGLAVLVIWLHRANIARLRAGTEPRVDSGATKDTGRKSE